MDKNLKCGFCKQGKEVQSICGKLWHDDVHKCTSHQRCMQYSALLCQYKMKKFGGFKVKEVLKEQARGNKLKCSICQKLGKGSKSKIGGSASAGCAIQKCKKTFHFYCARVDGKTMTRRIVMGGKGGQQESVVLYRVFCSKEHEQKFLEPGMELTEDSDSEEYLSSSTSDSDIVQVVQEDTRDEDKHRKVKRIKLEEEPRKCSDASIVNHVSISQTFVVCFVEDSRNIPPPKFETLVNQARDLFHVEASGVFMWKYNADRFSTQHMLHLLVEIGHALCKKDESGLHHLICLLGSADVTRFDNQISSENEKSLSKKEDCCQSLRRKIGDTFDKVNKKFNAVVVKYCAVESLDPAHVAYLVLSNATDPSGSMRQQLRQSYDLNKHNRNLEKTCSVCAHDLEVNLFHEVKCKNECKKPNVIKEEARAMAEWLRNENDSFYSIEVFPTDAILLQGSESDPAAVDLLCDLLKPFKASDGNNSPAVIVIKPLDGRMVVASKYLRKCISKVVEERLTASHELFLFVGISPHMGIKKISEFLPEVLFSPKCGVGIKAFRVGSGYSCSVVLHLWINFEST